MTRIIVHAGFYKTGTTSLQRYVEQNAALFGDHFFYCSKAQLSEAAIAAREFGARPFWWRRSAFRHAFERVVADLPDAKIIVMSREQFSGTMPGFKTILGRRITSNLQAGIPLAKEIGRALRGHYKQDANVEFLFTLRDGESWVKSLYGHVQRSRKHPEDYAKFRRHFPQEIELQTQANRIAQAAGADRVHFSFLENTADHRFGPAKALLDVLDLPSEICEKLPAAHHENKSSPLSVRDVP